MINPRYIALVAKQRLTDTSFYFFTLFLPLGMYIFFGAAQSWSEARAGHGNVAAWIMASMSVYSAITCATSSASEISVELSNGWGRQVALTRGGLSSYLFTKLLVTAVISVVPVAVIFTAGALTTAVIDTPGRWAAAFALCCLGGIPFTLYGIMSATWLGARNSASISGAVLSLLAVMGGLFLPLSDGLMKVARFTPVYGVANLVRYPIQGSYVITTSGIHHEQLWMQIVNVVAWTLIFAVLCYVGRNRSTSRK